VEYYHNSPDPTGLFLCLKSNPHQCTIYVNTNQGGLMNNRGFSFLELMVAVLILAIIASWATTNYRKTVEHKRLQTETDKLFAVLHSIRDIGFNEDAGVVVKFVTSQQCSIYIDTGKQGTLIPHGVYNIPYPIEIGIPENGPTTAPPNIEYHTSGITPGWNSCIVLEASAIGEINTGAVYLRNTRLSKHCYCIGVASNKLVFDLYKWDGTWFKG